MSDSDAPDAHFALVARRILAGKVVPFLGAGANLCGRPEGKRFRRGEYLPSGKELASLLAQRSEYPDATDSDLLRVSQYVDAVLGEAALYEYLRETFDADYPPTALHYLLADVAGMLHQPSAQPLLILTTNYDDAIERAFEQRGHGYELLWYEAKKGSACGRFIHRSGDRTVDIKRPNEYRGLADRDHAVILKLHGAVDRRDAKGDSYVITEDNYIDYLTRSDISRQIPITLRQQIYESHFLFLGYSLRDWNLRVILHRIWGQQSLDLKSWAIQRREGNSEIEKKLWSDRGDVDILYVELDDYIPRLRAKVEAEAEARAELAL